MKPAAATTAPDGEFRAGWPTLLMALAGVATSVSALLIYTLGSFIVPLETGLGWDRADLQLTVSFLAAGGALSVNLAGPLNARHGMRRVTAVSALAVAAGFLAMTQLQGSVGWLYAAYFVLPFVGLGTTPVTWSHAVSLRFTRHRGLALSIVLCGTGLTAALLPPLLSQAMAQWGWQAGYAVLALVALAMWLSLAWRGLPGRLPPPQAAAPGAPTPPEVQGEPFARVLRNRKFWLCNLALGLVVSAIYGMAANILPVLRGLGLSAAQAGAIFSSFGVALIAGRIVVGLLIDRLWAPGVAAVALALPAVGCTLLLQADAQTPLLWLIVATALCGIGSGAEFDVAAYLVSRYFGLRDYGRVFGLHLSLVTVGSALAPFAFAAMLRGSDGYDAILASCALACVAGPLLLLLMGRYPRFSPSEPRLDPRTADAAARPFPQPKETMT
ncbi:MFS transporter [Pseudorhodoferax sp. LjRoot39]|uniref:MFS transporter n=1 Tax=Pseudorhodoferax sp. LjRoot39 TaxID=3342328 RepID=UPI003ECFD3F7